MSKISKILIGLLLIGALVYFYFYEAGTNPNIDKNSPYYVNSIYMSDGRVYENYLNIPVRCFMASEYRYQKQFYTKDNLPSKILKGDILFMLWDGDTMTANSSKHVCVSEFNSTRDKLYCIGGNQKDKICTLEYERKNIYAMFRPIY